MASSKSPKHDFAPAWLKIPDQDNQKGTNAKAAEQSDRSGRSSRRDDYYNTAYGRYGGSDYSYAPLQRQRSFENYYEDRRYSPQKFRHHSVDDDYYGGTYSYGPGPGAGPYYNGYNYEKYGSHYRSQPSLYRDGKYTHPNARFSQQQINGAYPPYYDPYGYDYYPGEPYYGAYMRPASGGKRPNFSDRESKAQAKGDKDKDTKQKESSVPPNKGDSLDDEFPSLNGDAEKAENKPAGTVGGVWDKPLITKGMSNGISNRHDDNPQSNPDSSSRDLGSLSKNSNVYKALIPNKSSMTKKQSKDGWKAATSSKDMNSNTKPAVSSPVSVGKGARETSKDRASQSTTPPVDILNTRLVTQPKNLADKKSDFLKALKQGNSDGSVDVQADNTSQLTTSANASTSETAAEPHDNHLGQHDDSLVNGFDDLNVDAHKESNLSSSLEAEQRLLRAMGWNEADNEEDYVITEEDVREFHRLKEMEQQKNGLKRVLPKTWSPQHLPTFQPPLVDDLNDTLSSTSEDSDLDMN